MSAAFDRWLTRLYRAVGGSLFLALCAVVAYAAGDRHRPDHVRSAERPTPEIVPGDAFQARLMLPERAFDAPPRDRDGKPRTIETQTEIAIDLPCGPPMRVERSPAACNRVLVTFRRQRRPDTITPFRSTCGR